MKKILILFIILLNLLLISCNNKTYEVNFIAGDGGYISGIKNQIIEEDKNTQIVKAIPDEDYIFVSWSDGDTNPKKIIENVKVNITLKAIFKKMIYEYPSIYILTENYKRVSSKEEYVSCNISVIDNKNPEYSFDNIAAKIKGRGNSTWDMPKKPYRIKFNEKIDLFGNGEAKDWTLIANYVDPTGGLRNYLAYAIGTSFDDLPYTTTTQFAEVYLNNDYLGLYLVCEQIEVGTNRVEISDKITNDISFLVELDNKHDSDAILNLDYFILNNQPYSIKAPKTDGKDFNENECKRIRDYLDFSLNIIKNKTYEEVLKYIDVNSFADGYIIHELFSSVDVNYTSWYLSKDKEGLITNATIWDFDISVGNVDYNDQARFPNKLYAVNNTWYKYLLRHDEFNNLVKTKINKYYDIIHEIVESSISDIMNYKKYYDRNFAKWQTIGIYVWPNPKEIVTIKTWEGQIEFVKNWLYFKLDYMKLIYDK